MSLSIRPAQVDDADHIARLTADLGYDVVAADVAARLARLLAREDQQFLLAEIDGRPVGWMHVGVAEYVETGAFAVINGLVVDGDRRGQGTGRLLLERAEDWARNRGLSVMRLWSTTSRERAHRFYERHGYTKIKTQHAFAKSLIENKHDLAAFIPRVQP